MCLFSFIVSETGSEMRLKMISVRERILKEKEVSIGIQESVLQAAHKAKLSESYRKYEVKLKEKEMQCQELRKEVEQKGKLL